MKYFVPLLLMIIVGGAGYYLYTINSAPSSDLAMEAPTSVMLPEETPVVQDSADAMMAASNFTVNGTNFSFTPQEITVKQGDLVKITFNNTGGNHDLVIDEFDVRTPVISDGQTATVEFTADRVGQFEFYCSVGEHRAMGMVGTLTVTE